MLAVAARYLAAAARGPARNAAAAAQRIVDDGNLASGVSLLSTSSVSRFSSSPSPCRGNDAVSGDAEENTFDVAIVGAGMVGLALAGELAHNPATRHLRVALADANPAPDPSAPLPRVPGLRVSTLTPASIQVLRRAGAWRSGSGSGSERDGGKEDVPPPPSSIDLSRVSEPFHSMQVWDEAGGCVRYSAEDGLRGGGFLSSLFDDERRRRSPSSSSCSRPLSMGAVAENEAIVKSLLASVRSSPSPPMEFFACGGLSELRLPSTSAPSPSSLPLARLSFSDASLPQISARLVVGTDGARSAVRTLAGIRLSPFGRDYEASAVVATVRLEQKDENDPDAGDEQAKNRDKKVNVAWQRFLSTGPLALLPLRDNYWSVVWSTTPEHARELCGGGGEESKAPSPEEFAAAVDAALRRPNVAGDLFSTPLPPPPLPRSLPARVTAARGAPQPRSFPLRRQSAGVYCAPRLVLAGDAAHSVHPLGGQGVNLGLADASLLARCLGEAASVGADVGTLGAQGEDAVSALERSYGAPRRAADELMSSALDALERAFASQRGPVARARALALGAIDGSAALRSAIVKYAMGL